jgi:hypothetical protein
LARTLSDEHRALRPEVAQLRDVGDLLGDASAVADGRAMAAVRRAVVWLVDDLAPHERLEDHRLYPSVATALGGSDPTATMSRSHMEIERLTTELVRTVEQIGDAVPGVDHVRALQRTVYGLYAVLELHFAQEDESYLSLAEEPL